MHPPMFLFFIYLFFCVSKTFLALVLMTDGAEVAINILRPSTQPLCLHHCLLFPTPSFTLKAPFEVNKVNLILTLSDFSCKGVTSA